MYLVHIIEEAALAALNHLYEGEFTKDDFQINQTKSEFKGDYTVVLFVLLKKTRKAPAILGQELGEYLITNHKDHFSDFNVVSGFLNLTINTNFWLSFLAQNYKDTCYGKAPMSGKKVMVEYSSPNTNKPLHLGHLRNNFLGWSIGAILQANGYEVIKSSIVNDRGIHICKSMFAWQQFANGETPEMAGIKGDHLVGKYYVRFEQELRAQTKTLEAAEVNEDYSHYIGETEKNVREYKKQIVELQNGTLGSKDEKIAKLNAAINEWRRAATPVMKAVSKMLENWEADDADVKSLWKKMNGWVYEGMNQTYAEIGSNFDKTYYESNTYLLGKEIVANGLKDEVFYKKEDGSVWIDLTKDGLDEKLVLRSNGTSVYITQDIGLAQQKYDEYAIDRSIYVIGDEQNYHMKVLQLIAKKLQLPYADDIQHLSYGMVELPDGKMKSREGTVVDADDIVEEIKAIAAEKTEALGKVDDFSPEALKELYHTIGLGSLKFFLLRVDPKKKMVFNPEESIDFQGFTAPFIQFNHARIKSVLRKESETDVNKTITDYDLLPAEKELIVMLERYPAVLEQSATELNPSVIASYVYSIAKSFSSFYAAHSIANADNDKQKTIRLQIAEFAAIVIKSGMQLLGIKVPEQM